METMNTTRNNNSRFPFTSSQWQELEHQALVYKYMISGMPIPPDLLFSIQRSLDSSTKLFLHHQSPHQSIGLGWNCFQMGFGRKIDPEPGRCRRTDGKKWRCSKEAYPDSKYCERHMHRGRNRSRKPVEVNLSTNSSPNTPISTKTLNHPSFLYPQLSTSRPPGNLLSSQDRFWLESSAYPYSEKDNNRYGMKEEVDEHPFSIGDSWHLEPLAMNNNQSKQQSFSSYQNGNSYPKRKNDNCCDHLGLKFERKDEPQKKIMHHFFDESPHIEDKDSSTTTHLSISIPNGAHDFFQTHNDK